MNHCQQYILRFDGGSRGNPGEGGAGAVIFNCSDDSIVAETWEYLGSNVTNNQAEYHGLIAGLNLVIDLNLAVNGNMISIEGDSKLVISQVSGLWKVKNDDLRQLYHTALSLLKIIENHVDRISHIYRIDNSRADLLVNRAIDTKEDETVIFHKCL